jgi:hypothetical protein
MLGDKFGQRGRLFVHNPLEMVSLLVHVYCICKQLTLVKSQLEGLSALRPPLRAGRSLLVYSWPTYR